jgi:GNAT superfamily N-acetyltransferase
LERIRDKEKLSAYFRQDLPLHAYSLGDLDDPYWSRTSYYGIQIGDRISEVFSLYRGPGLPVLLAMGPREYLNGELLEDLVKLVPDEAYAHLSPGLENRLGNWFSLQPFGLHQKMTLENPDPLKSVPTEDTFRLTEKDLPDLLQLFAESYPDNAFDPSLLDTGKIIGIRDSGKLISTAGLHVYSPRYRVAALGNVTTHPDFRNQGCARSVVARLCLELSGEVDFIGLNVKCANLAAVQLYQSLGFKICANYSEFALKRLF